MILKTTKVNKLEWVSTSTPNLSYITPRSIDNKKLVYSVTSNDKEA